MTNKEYTESLNKISHNIKSGNVQTLNKMIDELYDYKPVSLMWNILKAKIMLKSKCDIDEIRAFLDGCSLYGENSSCIEELSKLYEKMSLLQGDALDAKRNRFSPYICMGEPYRKYADEINAEYSLLGQREREFCEDVMSDKKAADLMDSFFVVGNAVCCYLTSLLLEKRNAAFDKRDKLCERSNFGYLREKALSDKNATFIVVVTDETDRADCNTAAVILSLLEKRVYLLDMPLDCPVDNKVDMRDTVAISMENAAKGDITVIPPISVIIDGVPYGNNRAQIIDHIVNNCTEDISATVLCGGTLTDMLRETPTLRRQMDRLSEFSTPGEEKYLAFSRVGSYISYIGALYGFDVKAALDSPAECEYSIVVPARNSSRTLRHTLKTCLEQSYAGSYEIVLSDNSSDGNTEVYDLYKELNDSRIKYYKTPKELNLTKSFEFAFLKARGEFIFSIGSDDGVLPWGLSAIDKVRKSFPDEEIISWDRGFYAWPGFNGGQENQLIIPKYYQKDQISVSKIKPWDVVLNACRKNKNDMYFLPTMYINSGFKKTYLRNLQSKTGCIMDGPNQDIYLGVINACLYDETLYISFPITVAGMSSGSLGSMSSRNRRTSMYKNKPAMTTAGLYMQSAFERAIPNFEGDIYALYLCVRRMYTIGLRTINEIESIVDKRELYNQLYGGMTLDDDFFESKADYFRYIVSQNAEELYNDFDKAFKSIKPIKLEAGAEEKLRRLKAYDKGFINGSLVLDASEFNVTDIYGATGLFKKILNL